MCVTIIFIYIRHFSRKYIRFKVFRNFHEMNTRYLKRITNNQYHYNNSNLYTKIHSAYLLLETIINRAYR